MICSGDLGFYEKRSLPPKSVTNKRSRRTEIEKMSNFRNLFCTVALAQFLLMGQLECSGTPSRGQRSFDSKEVFDRPGTILMIFFSKNEDYQKCLSDSNVPDKSNCPCMENCPKGCPCDSYACGDFPKFCFSSDAGLPDYAKRAPKFRIKLRFIKLSA